MSRIHAAALCLLLAAPGGAASAQTSDYVVNDAHFHLTDYVQQGTDIHEFLRIMGTKVGRDIHATHIWRHGGNS